MNFFFLNGWYSVGEGFLVVGGVKIIGVVFFGGKGVVEGFIFKVF